MLGLAGYAVVFGLAGVDALATHQDRKPPLPIYIAPLMVLYLLLSSRIIAALRAWPERRAGSAVMLATMVMFTISGTIAGVLPGQDRFPNVTEIIFLPPYAALAAFLIIDVGRWRRMSLGLVLEALVIAGGAGCVGAVVVITPVAEAFPRFSGPDLLLLLTYPLLAVAMMLVVLADVRLGRRDWSIQTMGLLIGLTLLAIADSNLLRSAARPDNAGFGPAFALLWGGGLALVVTGACGPRRLPSNLDAADHNPLPPVLAASVALAVLTARPGERQGGYLAALAVFTLIAAGVRLAIALREARGAAEAYRMSQTDELTGLPNRRAVVARAEAADAADAPLSLLLADLDGFKQVNDTLGHPAGDTVLRLIAGRLRAALPTSTLLARLGGDEFAVVLPADEEFTVLEEAARIREVIARPVDVLGHSITIDASIGVALRAAHTTDGPDLLRRADIAMYQAKAQRTGALLYQPEKDDFTTDRLHTAEYLRRGIPAGQLQVWYQPQVDAATHRLAGLEALVRWNHPKRGVLSPNEFLGIARQSGLMPTLTEVVIGHVLADARGLIATGSDLRMSFNVAPAELLNAGLMDRLLTTIDQACLPPGTLALEITEDSLLADPSRARVILDAISRHHVEVSIDDYGAGYSSLAYLRDLPVHELKMDRSFVATAATDPRSRIIVSSTSQMAAGLGLRTVAEGVEDAQAADQLQALGVNLLQGYHFARPMPFDDIQQWIASWSGRESIRPPAAPGAARPPRHPQLADRARS